VSVPRAFKHAIQVLDVSSCKILQLEVAHRGVYVHPHELFIPLPCPLPNRALDVQ